MKRVFISILLGAFLGIFCIIGVGARLGFEGNSVFLFAMWYNRVIMGLVIGLSDRIVLIKNSTFNSVLRGLVLGTLVTAAIFLSSEFHDVPSFFAGIVYGIIIDAIATKLGNTK